MSEFAGSMLAAARSRLADSTARCWEGLVWISFLHAYRKIVDRIDKNGDGSVSEKELEDWIRHVSRRCARERLADRYNLCSVLPN